MKLSKSQIDSISQRISPSIYYWDIREELVDHLASAVEQEMELASIPFEKAVTNQLDAFNPDRFQRAILINRHLATFKKLFAGWLDATHAGLALFVTLLTYFLVHIGSIDPGQTYASFSILMITTYTAPFFYGIFDKRLLRQSEFLSAINSSLLLYFPMSFGFDILLGLSVIPVHIFMPLFMGLLVGQLMICIRLVNKTYEKIKFASK
ncbi:hypothetical protein C943_03982 [Mariniradius saccharolyticus AK6]|uniref:Uncharacterized protein n=1 Tax=Mariniradius saccharolyticus AK6 TaxID=1239962 RepID=M7X9Q7_9BACT|nr:hypothetical protein [Mariniradius saccharolyticus]EMS34165.1 hypothetical protein C943_03982 [Mariniradius saccharolyticus AK6]